MNSERKGEHPGRDAPGAPLQAAPHGEISLRLEGFRERVAALGGELDDLRRKIDELASLLAAPGAAVAAAPLPPPRAGAAAAAEHEDERDRQIERIQDQIHALIHEEIAAIADAPAAPPPRSPGMVCPSCGALVQRTEEACPQCGAAAEADAGGGGRSFPLSPEKFLQIFNDRLGWFIKTSDKALYYADRKGEYEKAIDLLRVVVQFMEENLSLIKSKHRDFKLALSYAYLGRCYFQSRRLKEAIEHYKKGILLGAGNSYNCEIGLTAVYRDIVRNIAETAIPLTPESHPYLSRREIDGLNRMGTRSRR
jgi:tetratricopeptide (TPR) repeat protein